MFLAASSESSHYRALFAPLLDDRSSCRIIFRTCERTKNSIDSQLAIKVRISFSHRRVLRRDVQSFRSWLLQSPGLSRTISLRRRTGDAGVEFNETGREFDWFSTRGEGIERFLGSITLLKWRRLSRALFREQRRKTPATRNSSRSALSNYSISPGVATPRCVNRNADPPLSLSLSLSSLTAYILLSNRSRNQRNTAPKSTMQY